MLDLPPELTKLHDVFRVSMLRIYRLDESHIARTRCTSAIRFLI